MPLAAGTRLGPYEIQSALGAGGMGEVYRARDTRLDRTVAIKILPEALAADPQFRERFDREARTISQLDHPHICALYDVGEQDGTAYLVMQYLEGETLAARLERGAVPVAEALTLATQIAGALDAAHRAGIVHRDLKPGNVMLTKVGAVRQGSPQAKLLDFGLAKATAPAVAAGGLSMAPTMGAPVTAQGTILGTFQYMAPEQLEGKEADGRTDLFAFGCVFYEMATGRRAFEGTTQASLIAAIMNVEPTAASQLVPLTPALLDRLIGRCLAKDPTARWQSAADIVEALSWIANGTAASGVSEAPAAVEPRRATRLWMGLAVGSLALAAAAVALTAYVRSTIPGPLVTRLDVVTPPSVDPFSFALSPDGRQLVFVANKEGSAQGLWLRPFDQAVAQPLAGTENAQYPFWSPDSRAVAFFADGRLKRIDLAGGAVEAIGNAPGLRGGAWGPDGTILFAPNTGPLMRIPANGGTPVPATEAASGQVSHRFPSFLPDGRRFLFLATLGAADVRGVYVGSLDGGTPTRLLASDYAASYAPPGYLLVASQGVLTARRFNPATLDITGDPLPLAQGIGASGMLGQPAFSVSTQGVLAYRGGSGVYRRRFIWVDRTGRVTGTLGAIDEASQMTPALSRDANRLALLRVADANVDVWIEDATRATMTRFTSDQSVDGNPVWSPDGQRIVFASARSGRFDLFVKPADSSADEEPLLTTPLDKAPQDWSADGRVLLYSVQDPKNASELWALPLTGERTPFPVVQTPFDDVHGEFSPDGRWVAYASNETGRYEIYVTRFPGPGGKTQVSTSGGIYPRWRPDGRELFFIAPDNRMMAVPVDTAAAFTTGTPASLFATQLATGGNVGIGTYLSRAEYAVAADGRFLLNVMAGDGTGAPITIVQNWQTVLTGK